MGGYSSTLQIFKLNHYQIKSSLGKISPAWYPTHKKKFYFFLIPDYHLPTLGFPNPWNRRQRIHLSLITLQFNYQLRRAIMAKGQQRKTKEAKKPKKQPPPATLNAIAM
jgi:hypothetical protein